MAARLLKDAGLDEDCDEDARVAHEAALIAVLGGERDGDGAAVALTSQVEYAAPGSYRRESKREQGQPACGQSVCFAALCTAAF